MKAIGKVQVLITDFPSDEGLVASKFPNRRAVVADVFVRAIGHPHLPLIELRIVVPAQRAEEVLVGMARGETELVIDKIVPDSQMD